MMRKFLIGVLTVLSFATAFYGILVFRPQHPNVIITIPGRALEEASSQIPATKPVISTPTETPANIPGSIPEQLSTTTPTIPTTPTDPATVTAPSAPIAPEVSVPEDTPPPATAEPIALPPTNKHIYVSLKEQGLRYYEGDQLIGEFKISSGLRATPTPPGEYTVIVKRPFVNYFGENYRFPNTKWNLMFKSHSPLNYYIHGAYWHNNFGKPMSHGCVNVSYANMEGLYNWAEVGTPITIE